MKFVETDIKTFNKEYLEMIPLMKMASKEKQDELFIKKTEVFKFKSKAKIALILLPFYPRLMFFRNDDLLVKLTELNLRKLETRWFVSLDAINEQFDIIESRGILVDRLKALSFIRQHLQVKFSVQMLFFGTEIVFRDEVSMNPLAKYSFELKRRREYADGNPKTCQGLFDLLMNDLIDTSITQNENKFTIEHFIEITKAKTEKSTLKNLVDKCFDHETNGLSKTQFLSTIYDLFRIILQNYFFENETEFYDKKGYSGKSFSSFKAHKLRKILSI